MSAKNVLFSTDARAKMLQGVNKLGTPPLPMETMWVLVEPLSDRV